MSQYEHEPDDQQQPETGGPRLAVWTPIILTAVAVGGLVWWVQSDSDATIDRLRSQSEQDSAATEIELPFEVEGTAAEDGVAEIVVADVVVEDETAAGGTDTDETAAGGTSDDEIPAEQAPLAELAVVAADDAPSPAAAVEDPPEAPVGVLPPEVVETAEIPVAPDSAAEAVEELTVSPGPAPVATLPAPAASAAVTAESAQPVSVQPAESMLSVHRLPSLQPSSEAPAADLPTAAILPAPVAPAGTEAEPIARSADRTVQTEDRASVTPVTAEPPAIVPVSRPDVSVGTVAADLVAGTAERIRDAEIIRIESVDPSALDRLDAALPPLPGPADASAEPMTELLTVAPEESPPGGGSDAAPEAPAAPDPDAAESTPSATDLAAAGDTAAGDTAAATAAIEDAPPASGAGPARDAAGRLVITAETVDFADLRGDAEPDATVEPAPSAEADPLPVEEPGGVTRPVIIAESVDPAALDGATDVPATAEAESTAPAETEIAEAEVAAPPAPVEPDPAAADPATELAMLPPPDTLPAAAETEVEAAPEPEGPLPMVAALSAIEPPRPAWQRFAAEATPAIGDGPTISVIVTGLGQSRSRTEIAMSALPPAVGLAFDPYAAEVEALVAAARDRGHEILMTVPMEAATAAIDPGPMALSSALPPEENADRLSWVLDRARGYVGVLTPPEAVFAGDPEAMDPIIRMLRTQGLMVVAGTPGAIAAALPADLPVAEAGSAVAIPDGPQGFATMFEQAERTARETGSAVILVSPYPATLRSLAEWLETLPEKGLTLIPVTASVGDPQSAALP